MQIGSDVGGWRELGSGVRWRAYGRLKIGKDVVAGTDLDVCVVPGRRASACPRLTIGDVAAVPKALAIDTPSPRRLTRAVLS